MGSGSAPFAADDRTERLAGSIELSPIATVLTNPRLPDNPIVAANAAFTALTGYREEEILGRNCRFLGGEGTDLAARAALRDAVARRQPVLAELLNYRKDGRPFHNAVMIAPIFDAGGEVLFFIGSQMEVPGAGTGSRRAQAERLVAGLTPRQRQVLLHVVQGYRNKQIAAQLGIDEKTVKMHRAALLARLQVATSADAIRIGVEAGLAGEPSEQPGRA